VAGDRRRRSTRYDRATTAPRARSGLRSRFIEDLRKLYIHLTGVNGER
jgi:hypothetical protein